MSDNVLLMFHFRNCIVSGLMFKSLIHFEFIFTYSVRKYSNFILCTVFPAPCIEEAIFSPLYILASFVKDQLTIGAWVYLWDFQLISLVYISVFVPVPCCLDYCSFVVLSEARELDSSSSILSQECFGYSRFFVFPYKL